MSLRQNNLIDFVGRIRKSVLRQIVQVILTQGLSSHVLTFGEAHGTGYPPPATWAVLPILYGSSTIAIRGTGFQNTQRRVEPCPCFCRLLC